MLEFIGCEYDKSDALRAKEWSDGIDAYGFNALPSGVYDKGVERQDDEGDLFYVWGYNGLGTKTNFWTSSEFTRELEGSKEKCFYLVSLYSYGIYIDEGSKLRLMFSIRCIKD